MENEKFLVEVLGEEDNSIYDNSIQIEEMVGPLKPVEKLSEAELFGTDLEDFLDIQREIENEINIRNDLFTKIRKMEIENRKRLLTQKKLDELHELKMSNDGLREQIKLYEDNVQNEINSSSYR